MKNLKCYIDVEFTIEESFDRFTDEEKVEFMENKELMLKLFEKDLLKRLEYFSDNIQDLKTTITFEGDDSEI